MAESDLDAAYILVQNDSKNSSSRNSDLSLRLLTILSNGAATLNHVGSADPMEKNKIVAIIVQVFGQ